MNRLEIIKRKSKLRRNFIDRYKIINSYDDYINKDSDNKIIEKALSDNDSLKIQKLRIAKEYSEIISIYDKRINQLKELCIELDFDDIKYKFVGYYEVKFSKPINILLNGILSDINNECDEVIMRINNDGYDDSELCLEIDKDNLNKIDIINGLPIFMKRLGLGRKIYKKFIKDLGYISSFSGGDTNLDSSFVWKSISKDKDIYTFCNDNNIISFWKDLNYDKIMIKLREFYYKRGDEIVFDEDFQKKYKLNKDILLKLI
jgi:hypothetical protein